MTRVSAWLAIAFGVILAVLETSRNWGHWQWWPFWLIDYVAALLLASGGALALRARTRSWLTGGWGFACAMFWMSYFGHVEGMRAAASANPREAQLTTIIGGLFVVTVVGLVFSLVGELRSRAPRAAS